MCRCSSEGKQLCVFSSFEKGYVFIHVYVFQYSMLSCSVCMYFALYCVFKRLFCLLVQFPSTNQAPSENSSHSKISFIKRHWYITEITLQLVCSSSLRSLPSHSGTGHTMMKQGIIANSMTLCAI